MTGKLARKSRAMNISNTFSAMNSIFQPDSKHILCKLLSELRILVFFVKTLKNGLNSAKYPQLSYSVTFRKNA